jgi:hypothetical protein
LLPQVPYAVAQAPPDMIEPPAHWLNVATPPSGVPHACKIQPKSAWKSALGVPVRLEPQPVAQMTGSAFAAFKMQAAAHISAPLHVVIAVDVMSMVIAMSGVDIVMSAAVVESLHPPPTAKSIAVVVKASNVRIGPLQGWPNTLVTK